MVMKNFVKFTITIVVMVTYNILIPFSVHAQEDDPVKPTGIQVSPIRLDWQMTAGEYRMGKFNVRNYADGPREVSVSVENFFVSPDSEHVNLFGGESEHPRNSFNVIGWFDVPEDFTLASGEGKDVEFSVKVPEDQPTNGYFGTMLFQTKNKVGAVVEDSGAAHLGVNYRVGAIITLAVQGEGEPRVSGYIDQFTSDRKWYIDTPTVFNVVTKNDGNMHYKMGGKIIVTRFGKPYATIEVEPEVMYPDTGRTFAKKMYFDTWDFGIYNARVEMDAEQENMHFTMEIDDMYILPRRGMIYLAGGLCGGIFIFWFMKNFVTFGSKKRNDN